MIFYPHQKKIVWESERQFADLMQSYGYSLIYQPRIYIPGLKRNFQDNAFLAPDFFCIETKNYYEVVNSTTSFNWRKPDIFATILMGFPIRIVTPSGEPYIFKCYQYDLRLAIERLESRYFSLFPNQTQEKKHHLIQEVISKIVGIPRHYLWSSLERPKKSMTKEERRLRKIEIGEINKWIQEHRVLPF